VSPLEHTATLIARGTLYALVDACGVAAVPPRAESAGAASATCLYQGDARRQHAAIAPYLFHLDDATLAWIRSALWAEPWGLFVDSPVGLDVLKAHFRRYLVVESPTGQPLYFRFYDPRVLGPFLRSCNEPEITAFFGPVTSFGLAAPGSGRLTWLSRA
jgi:hypothetical protein